MSTAIIVDCRSRDLQVFSASVTETEKRGLVLRKATDIGRLADLKGEISYTVIILGSYAAQSSAGFVEVVRPAHHYPRHLAGGAGLGWDGHDAEGCPCRKGDTLRPITTRDGGHHVATVLSGGCSLTKVGGQGNSNVATAGAALAGLKLRAEMRGEIIVAEGQSDHVSGWAFKPKILGNGLGNDFPAEHRPEVFDGSPRAVLPALGPKGPAIKRVRRSAPLPPPVDDEFVEVLPED